MLLKSVNARAMLWVFDLYQDCLSTELLFFNYIFIN
jgi:hypothetical protein